MKGHEDTMQSLSGSQNSPVLQTKAHAQALIRGDISAETQTDVAEVRENFTLIKNGIISRSQQILRHSTTVADTQYLIAAGEEMLQPVSHAGVIYSSGGFMPPPLAVPSQSQGAPAPGSGTYIDWEI